MAKSQKSGNREAKKPKMVKAPVVAEVQASKGAPVSVGNLKAKR